jgi:hypothetical protein
LLSLQNWLSFRKFTLSESAVSLLTQSIIPMLVDKSITKPAMKKNCANHGAMRSPMAVPQSSTNARSSPMFSWTPMLEKTSTQRETSNNAPMNQKVMRCSWFATFHHSFQRRRFSSVSGATYPSDGAATSWPVRGETMLGMWRPMPIPLSRT